MNPDPKQTKPRIVIIMDDGLITSVITPEYSVDVLIIDYDIEGVDEDRLTTFDEDGPAYARIIEAESDQGQDRWARRAFEHFEKVLKNESPPE